MASYIRKNPPALILLDIMLPDVDGMDVCREIRKFSNIPIAHLFFQPGATGCNFIRRGPQNVCPPGKRPP
ncbi:MAG: hypothetical protein WAU91_19840 [Desulfatitalea sp.]